MKTPLIRQGEGSNGLTRILQQHDDEQREINRMITTANGTPDQQEDRRHLLTHRSPAGDEQRLRMIPAIARGVAGAIPGTRPDTINYERRH